MTTSAARSSLHRLVVPLNLHRVHHRTCETCQHLAYNEGTAECQRPNGPAWDAGDREESQHVCDRWTRRHNDKLTDDAERRSV